MSDRPAGTETWHLRGTILLSNNQRPSTTTLNFSCKPWKDLHSYKVLTQVQKYFGTPSLTLNHSQIIFDQLFRNDITKYDKAESAYLFLVEAVCDTDTAPTTHLQLQLQIRIQYPGSVLSGTAGLQRALLGSAGKAIPAPIGQDPWRRALIGQRYLQVFAFH